MKFKQTEICGKCSRKQGKGRSRTIGGVPEGWGAREIGECFEVCTGKGIHKSDRRLNGTYPIMGANGIIGYSDEFLVDGDYILTGRVGTLGEVSYNRGKFWISDNSIFVGNGKQGDLKFLYYYLKTFDFQALNVGSTQPLIKQSDIKKIKFPFPPVIKQRAIAKVLSDLDEKIELNHQMNKTLEAIGQAIFKRWFVDFEFPGYEKVRFVDDLPKGWHHGALGEIITIESGKRPGEKSETKTRDFTVPLIGASSVMGFVKDTLYNEPILIIGRVGTHGVVQRISWPSFPSDNTLVIRSKHFEFVYQILKMIDYESLNVGTTQPLITQTAINKYDVVIPSNEALEQFETYISGLFKKVVANNKETESLIDIRDSLLPRLMNGRIRVNS